MRLVTIALLAAVLFSLTAPAARASSLEYLKKQQGAASVPPSIPVPEPPPAEERAAAAEGGCPVRLDSPVDLRRLNGARTVQFGERIPAAIPPGLSDRERIAAVSEAASLCGLHLGSCGRTAETVYGILGLPRRAGNKVSVSGAQMRYLDTIKCEDGSAACKREARREAYARFQAEIPGWPQTFTRELEPGDRLVVFNANRGPFGTHTTIFLRWARPGTAEVVQGAWGRLVSAGTVCVYGCPNPAPIVRVVNALPRGGGDGGAAGDED